MEVGYFAGNRRNNEQNLRQHRVRRQVRVIGGDAAVKIISKDFAETPANVRIVALARHIDESRHETLERIAAHEQAHPLPLLHIDDAHGIGKELVLAALQQLIAWIALEDMGQCLAVMAGLGQPAACQGIGHLVPQ